VDPDELSVCVRVASLGEANALFLILDGEEIPYRERPYRDTAFDRVGVMMQQQSGWGELWVRAADEARVRAAQEALQTGPALESPDDERPATEEPARPRRGLGGLWLLIILGVVLLGAVIASAILGSPDSCGREEDAAQRAACEQRRAAPVPVPLRDWR
jgi:hypothetical protein